ncbi:hypothetical protein M758_7G097800 [Ceratodon purpureus]|nr:hypothetical protein M758_7G097800 [Ceratodon purpureus]KAG0610863.1 hypothetical protein M758_7G097800 [Ceratodon purpureus]KAG0610865.1 hypothetical protein M758_7G097800 [Ceratodon purpureus]
MDGASSSNSQENYGDTGVYSFKPVSAEEEAHCRHECCIKVTKACTHMDELFRTWRDNDWDDKESFLRLNRRKCEDLLCNLKRAKELYQSNKCELVAREFLAAVQQAKFLVVESSDNKWLLKALELWDCSQHFFEVFMDLFWWARIMKLGVTNTCFRVEEQGEKLYFEQLLEAQRDDKKTLGAMVKTAIQDKGVRRKDDPEHELALILEDRLNDQSIRHPSILTKFLFCIRTRYSLLSKSSSKSGQNGVVLPFQWVYGKQFAVKMRQPNTTTVENMFRHEFDILDKYRSPYIVGVVGYWEIQSWLDIPRLSTTLCPFLLMEAMECDLDGLITHHKNQHGTKPGFSPLEAIKLMLPVAKALRFLHSNDVAHRDIKPQNIMCRNAMRLDFDDTTVKLIDFGEATANVSEIASHTNRPAGTPGYMDPEMTRRDPATGIRLGYDLLMADVFSFAMVFLDLLTWTSPWEESGIHRGREVQEKLNKGERPPLPNDLPEYVSFIVQCCWCADPPARPSFKDVCSMLRNAKLLLLDEHFFGEPSKSNLGRLFCYEDGDCMERSYDDRAFLETG